MSGLSDFGNGLIQAITGTNVAQLQAQATEVEQQLQVAIGTMIALQAITALSVILLVVMTWKERH